MKDRHQPAYSLLPGLSSAQLIMFTVSSFSHSSLVITDTCVFPLISSGYSQAKRIPMDSAVRKEGSLVYLQLVK